MLYYKTGFMLDDFPQLQANAGVLSMFRVLMHIPVFGWVDI